MKPLNPAAVTQPAQEAGSNAGLEPPSTRLSPMRPEPISMTPARPTVESRSLPTPVFARPRDPIWEPTPRLMNERRIVFEPRPVIEPYKARLPGPGYDKPLLERRADFPLPLKPEPRERKRLSGEPPRPERSDSPDPEFAPQPSEMRQARKPPNSKPTPPRTSKSAPEPDWPPGQLWIWQLVPPPLLLPAPPLPHEHGTSPDPPHPSLPWPWLPLPLQGNRFSPDPSGWYTALRDPMDNTLLMYACRAGRADIVAFLLESCPRSYAQALNSFGRNAAMIAHDSGHSEVLAMLLQAGVELQPANPALQWYLQNRGDLAVAARMQDWQPLANLLAQGHFMNLRDANGRTLLFHAVMNADLDAVRFLCGRLDSPCLGWKDVYGYSVFRYTTRIPNVQTGAAICLELKTHRRRMRWQRSRTRPNPDHLYALDFTEPAIRHMDTDTGSQ